jgi:hypothetical protein
MDKSFPLKERKCKTKQKPMKGQKWVTADLKKEIKEKNRMYRIYINNPTDENKGKYSVKNKFVQGLVKTAKKKYYTEMFSKTKNDTKSMWREIKKLTGDSRLKKQTVPQCDTAEDIARVANKLNEYFCNVGASLAANLPATNYVNEKEAGSTLSTSLFLWPTDECEIEGIIRSMPPKTSYGFDEISMLLLQRCCMYVSAPLTKIVNVSMCTGLVPKLLKKARVIPIHKSGNVNDFQNYRPISLLPVFSKILEKVIYRRLYSFLEKNHVMHDRQFGFRKGRTTAQALHSVVENVLSNIEAGKYTLAIFLDLSSL